MKTINLLGLAACVAASPFDRLENAVKAEVPFKTETGHILGLTRPQVDGEPFPMPATENEWGEFQYVDGSQCLDGGETGVWLRKGKSADKLVVYFQGGGACFNPLTCATAKKNPLGLVGGPGSDGILNMDDERNGLKDYSIVWVPYCSGDVFMGNGESDVPNVGTKKFYGRTNLNLMLQRLIPTFPDITDLVVTGESAGGFGAIANFDFILEGWDSLPANKLTARTLIDDCGPIFNDDYLAPCLQSKWRDLWHVESSIPPDCPQCTGADGGGLVNFYEFLQTKYPTANFGLIESANDSIISLFFGYGQDECQNVFPPSALPTFEEGLKNAAENYLGDRFATMLFPGNKHTYTTKPSFFTDEHAGVPLHEWYTALLHGHIYKINPWDTVEGDSATTTTIVGALPSQAATM